jgi:hypothetical protein
MAQGGDDAQRRVTRRRDKEQMRAGESVRRVREVQLRLERSLLRDSQRVFRGERAHRWARKKEANK